MRFIIPQLSIDISYIGDYQKTYSDIEHIVYDLFDELGDVFVVGILDHDVDFSAMRKENPGLKFMQFGVDYIKLDRSIRVTKLLCERLEDMGYEVWGSDNDSVEYTSTEIKYVADEYGYSQEEFENILVDIGYAR